MLFQSCHKEKDQYINCVEGLDIDEFHVAHDVGDSYFVDVHRYYYIFGNNDEREYVGEYVNLGLTKDKLFSLRVRVPCDLRGDRFPICEKSHYEEGEFELRMSGNWDFTQSYNETTYGNNNRRLEIVGELFLEITSSSIEEQIGTSASGDYLISCNTVMNQRYSELNLKFAVSDTDSISVLFSHSESLIIN